jgi:squalene-hopene/tetraprenyl-beta-curcumene cyclase
VSRSRLAVPAVAGLLLFAASAPAAEPRTAADPKVAAALVDKALGYLKTAQKDDGSFAAERAGPGITALVAAGLIRNGKADDPVTKKALQYVETFVQKDGGVYNKFLANYTTCVAVLAFKEANTDGKYDKVIQNAEKFLKTCQFALEDDKDLAHGGVGYDTAGKGRPDLSNTQYFIEAMLAAGVPKDDPAIQKALKFVSRCQNTKGETNDQPFAKKTTEEDEGGFVYNPSEAKDDKSPNRTAAGGLRSAGVMTYAGLKSFLYAGVSKEDPRVQGAVGWIRRHYTLDENPGQKDAGLYSYFHTFAKAMDALGEDKFVDADKKPHDWRADLLAALKARQSADGSWSNSNRAYMESTPELATAYALLALSYVTPKAK